MEKIPTEMLVVAAALRGNSGQWLMHKRPAGKHHAGLWEFPGGKVEMTETIENALIRELREELAIELAPSSLQHAGSASEPANFPQRAIVIELYTCDRWDGDPVPQEGGDVGWFSLDEAQMLHKPPLDESLLEQLIQKHAG